MVSINYSNLETPTQESSKKPQNLENPKPNQETQEKKTNQYEKTNFNPRKTKIPPRLILTNFIIASVLLGFYYYDFEKKRVNVQSDRFTMEGEKYGKPLVGVETKTCKPITDSHFRGKWMLLYFGFTKCPDICPEELRKVTRALNLLDSKILKEVQPIFMTCDPARDSCDSIENFLKGFHPKFIGLTGTPEQISAATKKYRVYYSGPIKDNEESEDYQVDHSIFFYLMDPYGNLKEYFGKNIEEKKMADLITERIKNYK